MDLVRRIARAAFRGPLGAGPVVAILLAFFALISGPVLGHDSHDYLNMAVFRPPVVPLLFGAIRAVFGESAQLSIFVVLQGLLAGVTAAWLAKTLAKEHELQISSEWVVLLVVVLPQIRAVRTIMSESVSYSLVCVLATVLVRAFAARTSLRRTAVALVATVFGLYLTRAQFVFIFPLLGIAVAVVLFKLDGWKDRARTLALVSLVAVAAVAIQWGYLYPRTGRFASVPVVGIQILTVVLHLSTEAEVAAIPDPERRHFAERILAAAAEEELLATQQHGNTASGYFGLRYNQILDIIKSDYAINVEGRPDYRNIEARVDAPAEFYVRMDDFTVSTSFDLLREMWPRYFTFMLRSIWEWLRHFAILAVALLLLSGVSWHRGGSGTTKALFCIALLWWANVFLVSAVEPPQMRYTFYFDSVLLAFAVALLARVTQSVLPKHPDVGEEV